MIHLTELKTAALSFFLLLLGFVSVHAQATPAAPPEEASSPFSAIATWLNHLGDTDAPPHRRTPSSTPLPRPRPAELVSAPVASNEEWSEFVPPPMSKNKTPTLLQIND
jgi:hypothetical protein